MGEVGVESRELSWLGKQGAIICFGGKKYCPVLLVLMGLILWYLYVTLFKNYADRSLVASDEPILNVIEHVVTFATFLTALYIGYIETERDWLASLPKKVDVEFLHDGDVVMECRDAYLAGEADVRAWAQQIGRQMAFGEDLKFLPNIQIHQPRPELFAKKAVLKFRATVVLTALPGIFKNDAAGRSEQNANVKKPKTVSWICQNERDIVQVVIMPDGTKISWVDFVNNRPKPKPHGKSEKIQIKFEGLADFRVNEAG